MARINVPNMTRDNIPPLLSTGSLVSLICDGINFNDITSATIARGNVIKNTEPQDLDKRR